MDLDFTLVVCDFGTKFTHITQALINSFKEIYPDTRIIYIDKEVPADDIDLIEHMQTNYPWSRSSPGSLRNIVWNQGLKMAQTEWVLFLDADMLLLKPLDELISLCTNFSAEFVFTTRPSTPYWMNMGFLLIKKTPNTLKFFDKMVSEQIENVKMNIGAGQFTFQKMLCRTEEEINTISTCHDPSKNFSFNHQGISFLGVSCDIYNNIYSKTEVGNSAVIHLKGELGTILLRDKKEDRYIKFLRNGIFKYSSTEIHNMNERLICWKKFSKLPAHEQPIDIEEYYKNSYHKFLPKSIYYRLRRKISEFKTRNISASS